VASEVLEALRRCVHADPALAAELVCTAPERFTARLLVLAAERGLDVTPTDIEDSIDDGRRAWMLRWIL
jgi:hypothetical protein